MANAGSGIRFADLGLDPIAYEFSLFGFNFALRWYSLAYIAGIVGGWWYMHRLIRRPGSPMARRHADDLVAWITIGIIAGGRLGYILFYKPEMLASPIEMLKIWEGGMSYHGGLIGVMLAVLWMCVREKISYMRVMDYVACVVPIGLCTGRLANFVNAELWGRTTTVPWGVIFPGTGDDLPRHPSQLYEAGLEGLALLLLLGWLFYRTDARYYPGRLAGVFLLWYGLVRSGIELLRQPDQGMENLSWGLTMGQTLSIPMVLGGVYLIATSRRRRQRIESIAGTASIA